jgi:hypothetical protein
MFKRKVRFFLSGGITFSYNTGIGDKYTITDYVAGKERVEISPGTFEDRWTQTSTTITEPYRMQTARDVRWHCGWLGGAGFSVLVDRFEIFAEGRYYYGMSDIMRNDTKYLFNEERTLRSELDNIFISVGVTFRLGKGGILAPPLRWKAAPTGSGGFDKIKLNM